MDIRLQHHLAQEFYRQQMLQRIPGNYFRPTNVLRSFKIPKTQKYLFKVHFWRRESINIEKQTEN